MAELRKLGERRNNLVHSKYRPWLNTEGREGLLRTNAKLRASNGEREEKQEELHSETLNADLERLAAAAARLEEFRLQLIDWLHPEE